jgi:hypothetical protein
MWAHLLAKHPEEPWPDGMQMISGRGDGGRHHWIRRPRGLLRMPHWLTENGVELKLHSDPWEVAHRSKPLLPQHNYPLLPGHGYKHAMCRKPGSPLPHRSEAEAA